LVALAFGVLALGVVGFGAFFVVVFLVAICLSLSSWVWFGVGTIAMRETDSYLGRKISSSGLREEFRR
jgi:bacteriorhodopsin